jgi:hypothetical protein
LYFSTLSNAPVDPPTSAQDADQAFTYKEENLANEHDRNYFMDTYTQPVPESEGSLVAHEDVFQSQKSSYNAPAYDNYEVNAQGLSGHMSPRLLEDGLLINQGMEIQYNEERLGTYCATECPSWTAGCALPQFYGTKIRDQKLYVNSNYTTSASHKFSKTFGNNLFFYFDYEYPANLDINPVAMNPYANATVLENFFTGTPNEITTRKENSDFIETFTNSQIASLAASGQFLEAKDYARSSDPGYVAEGIGGYRITTTDGKTYHYSRPVYQFEQIYRRLGTKPAPDGDDLYPENDYYREVRKMKPYATHWLLTAITGPDYVKMSSNSYPSEGDLGYWVRFDYGKWTDGYIWRTPYNGYDDISSQDNAPVAEYSWGRKQLVYLDKIVTRTHTALFVKSLRDDDVGKQLGTLNQQNYPSYEDDKWLNFDSQKCLKLDEIILVRNKDFNNSVVASTQVTPLISGPHSHQTYGTSMGMFDYLMNQDSQVIDKNDFALNPTTGKYAIYDKAVKVVKLNQDYLLAQQTPSSSATLKGRLTLEGVTILGKAAQSTIPPYTFEYGSNPAYIECAEGSPLECNRDDWGYNKSDATAWTMTKIHSPTGATIEFNYEPDQYYTEAFARKIFNEHDLKFKIYHDENGANVLEFQKLDDAAVLNFNDYFNLENPTALSFYCCHSEPDTVFPPAAGDKDWLYIRGESTLCQVKSVSATNVVFFIPVYDGVNVEWDTYDQVTGSSFRGLYPDDDWYQLGDNCDDGGTSHTRYNFNFNVLANKSPIAGNGGGLRVSQVSVVNEVGERLSTTYNYNDPVLPRSSGITSYAPGKGEKYVAYRSEIPGPRVIYEYVKTTQKGKDNNILGSTLYQFSVLKPVAALFNTNLNEGDHFKATVAQTTLDTKTTGVSVALDDNFGTVGNVIKVSQINSAGQVVSQLKNQYLKLGQFDDATIDKPGHLKESFHSVKSVYKYEKEWMTGAADVGVVSWSENCDVSKEINLKKRMVNTSSKTTYPVVQYKSESVTENQKKVTEYKRVDPKTGLFLETRTQLADGKLIRTRQVPAYTKYTTMGSKVVDINNKHMLTQETMDLTELATTTDGSGTWKTLGASITTWNKTWSYQTNTGVESPTVGGSIWRKEGTFVWKDLVDTDGAANTAVTESSGQFTWGATGGGVPFVNSKWLQTSEILRYSHWSLPLEIADVNNNCVSSKMADNFSKILVSGDTRYTEMYYTGAEYVDPVSTTWFEGEVQGQISGAIRVSGIAHTGTYSIKPNGKGIDFVKVTANVGAVAVYNEVYKQPFRPGRYKVSVWGLKSGAPSTNANLKVNTTLIPVSEIVDAGCWEQLNYYFDLAPGTTYTISMYATNIGTTVYFDDFRLSPVAASLNSYVYDQNTDELVAILDANNMGSAYKYDSAGKLSATYVETPDMHSAGDGGFKLVSQNEQNYKGDGIVTTPAPSRLDNCPPQTYAALAATILPQCVPGEDPFEIKYVTQVTGGSGSYSYQYKWLLVNATNTFSDYVYGPNTYFIPYAAAYCPAPKFNKKWSVNVKVHDLITNLETTASNTTTIGTCNYQVAGHFSGDVQVGTCSGYCSPEQYSLQIHLSDPAASGNFKYEYSFYNGSLPFAGQTLNWVDVTDSQGKFCPVWTQVANAACPSGFKKMCYYTVRITNLTSGESTSPQAEVFTGDCVQ